MRHKHRFLHDFPFFYALQETDNWTISAIDVPGHIVYGRDLAKTAILCPRHANPFRRSWISHERFTAILVGSTMILSVYMPHSGRYEKEYIATLEAVRDIMSEGKNMGAVDFFIGGDINIELKLEPDHEDHQGLDGIDWYGIYGPECLGEREDFITYEKKIRWLQLLRQFGCVVTNTWVEKGNPEECYTWRAWGSRVRRKQLDYNIAPRDIMASTWYLNKVRIRTWDHFPVVVKIEEKEMRMRKGKKSWAGWSTVSDVEEKKFQELCLCPAGTRSWIDDVKDDGLVALQSRLEGAVAQVKATTTASRNNKKFMVPDEIREMAALAAQCRDPVRRKVLRKKAQKARREFDARVGALPRGKVIKKPVVTKLWVNVRASEDREEWNEEVRLHCEKCYDDKSETPEVQAERIR